MTVAVDNVLVELLAAFDEVERCLIQVGKPIDLTGRRTVHIRCPRAAREARKSIVPPDERPLISPPRRESLT